MTNVVTGINGGCLDSGSLCVKKVGHKEADMYRAVMNHVVEAEEIKLRDYPGLSRRALTVWARVGRCSGTLDVGE